MYQLRLNKSKYEDFKRRVKCELILRSWEYKDLARETKYSESAIKNFMSKSESHSRFIAFAIAEVLEMEIKQ